MKTQSSLLKIFSVCVAYIVAVNPAISDGASQRSQASKPASTVASDNAATRSAKNHNHDHGADDNDLPFSPVDEEIRADIRRRTATRSLIDLKRANSQFKKAEIYAEHLGSTRQFGDLGLVARLTCANDHVEYASIVREPRISRSRTFGIENMSFCVIKDSKINSSNNLEVSVIRYDDNGECKETVTIEIPLDNLCHPVRE